MNKVFNDIKVCFKVALMATLPLLLIGGVIGGIYGLTSNVPVTESIFRWIFNFGIWICCFGLFLCAMGFVLPNHRRDFNNQDIWRKYFYKMDFISVVFTCCIIELSFLYFLEKIYLIL